MPDFDKVAGGFYKNEGVAGSMYRGGEVNNEVEAETLASKVDRLDKQFNEFAKQVLGKQEELDNRLTKLIRFVGMK